MTFKEYWTEVEKTHILPNVAIQLLPNAFSEKTKRKMVRRDPEEIARMLDSVIDEINNGSVETVDTLLRRRL